MKQFRLFLLAGKSGSGKSNAAKYIKKYYDNKNEKSVITSLSKYLKLYAQELFGYCDHFKPEIRDFLQKTGNLIRIDMQNPSFLVDRLYKDIEIYKYLGINNIIIDDVRLIKEIVFFKNVYYPCYTIHFNTVQKSFLNNSQKNHLTEIELDTYSNFDYTISGKSLDEVEHQLEKILEEVK